MKTVHLHLEYKHWNNLKRWELVFESDTSFEGAAQHEFKSIGDYCEHLNNSSFIWKTQKMIWIATSTSECELLAFT